MRVGVLSCIIMAENLVVNVALCGGVNPLIGNPSVRGRGDNNVVIFMLFNC